MSSAEGRASAAEKDLAVLRKDLEQQKERTATAIHDAQISRNAANQLHKNFQDSKMNESNKNLQRNEQFMKQQAQIESLELSLAKMMSKKETNYISCQSAREIIKVDVEKIRAQEKMIAQLRAEIASLQLVPKHVLVQSVQLEFEQMNEQTIHPIPSTSGGQGQQMNQKRSF